MLTALVLAAVGCTAASTSAPAVAGAASAPAGSGAATGPASGSAIALDRANGRGAGSGSLDTAALQAALDAIVSVDGYVGVTMDVAGPTGHWSGSAGMRRVDAPAPARPGDRTRVASVTKMMVAALVLQEVERGRWTLDTTVGSVWPGLLAGHDAVTLRQLLSHTSGAPDYLAVVVGSATTLEELRAAVSRPFTDAELVADAHALPWQFDPGSQWSYSNTNYVVLGMLLARVNGQPLQRLLERRVFGPAGMHQTAFATTPRIEGAHLTEYARLFDGPLVSFASFDPSVFSGAGAVVSTAEDLDRFQLALSGGRLVSRQLVDLARTPVPAPGNQPGYGLGTYQLLDVCPAPDGSPQFVHGHDGASFGTFTLSYAAPDGSRRVSLSYTGRPYAAPTGIAPFQALYLALAQTCPTALPTARQAPGAVAVPAMPTLPDVAAPWLSRLVG